MARNTSPNNLPNDFFENDNYPFEKVYIGYRDEGPDAWANSKHFDGPAWVRDESGEWEFYKDGVTITGYCGLKATVITVVDSNLHVTTCYGEEY